MLNAKDIRNIKFSKSVGGYKQEEVDVLLDKIEVDYDQYDRLLREQQSKIEGLSKEIESYKSSQNSIQNVLLSAQKLADQIVDEAKIKSAEIINNAEKNIENITVREKELSAAFDKKTGERKAAVETAIEAAVSAAQSKTASIESAATDAVARQQILFEKLRLEVSAFKADITRKYKEHLEVLQKLPDEVPMDPKHIAEVVASAVDQVPDIATYVSKLENEDPVEAAYDEPHNADVSGSESGFVVADVESGDNAEEEKE